MENNKHQRTIKFGNREVLVTIYFPHVEKPLFDGTLSVLPDEFWAAVDADVLETMAESKYQATYPVTVVGNPLERLRKFQMPIFLSGRCPEKDGYLIAMMKTIIGDKVTDADKEDLRREEEKVFGTGNRTVHVTIWVMEAEVKKTLQEKASLLVDLLGADAHCPICGGNTCELGAAIEVELVKRELKPASPAK